jgi:hypothetical protein
MISPIRPCCTQSGLMAAKVPSKLDMVWESGELVTAMMCCWSFDYSCYSLCQEREHFLELGI